MEHVLGCCKEPFHFSPSPVSALGAPSLPSLGSRDGDGHGKIRLIRVASGLCGSPPSRPGTRCFCGSRCPAEAGFRCGRFSPTVPAAEPRRCVPFPRGGSGTLRPGQDVLGWDPVPEGAHSGDRVCASDGIPRTCVCFCPIKNYWSISQHPRVIWGYWGMAVLVTVSPSLELGVPVMEQSLPRACRAAPRAGGAVAPRGFSLILFRCQTHPCSQVNAIPPPLLL